MSEFDISAYLGVFLDEVDEQLQILEEEVLHLEQDGEKLQTIQRIFRAAHTLKGSSAAMGFDKMKELTHKVENLFDLIRNQQLQVNTDIINVIFESIDFIKALKEAILNGTIEAIDISPVVNKLEKVKDSAGTMEDFRPASKEEEHLPHIDDVFYPEVILDVYQKDIVEKAFETGFQVMAIYVSIRQDAMLKSVRAFLIQNNLKEIGEIIAAFPPPEIIEDDAKFKGSLVYLIITNATEHEAIQIVNNISDIYSVNLTKITKANLAKFVEGNKMEFSETKQEVVITSNPKNDAKIKQTVRVDVERLEHLMNLVGELVIDQTRLADVRSRLEDRYSNDVDIELFSEVGNHLGQVVSELQEGMMKTRMLPIEQLFNRFPRMVRDLGQKANKEIDFVIEGKETELDRNLIEEIGDPIIHLLRNAIDHGIEDPNERETTGKSRKGQVLLKASHEENHIVITISDDGRGIDPEKIKASAIKKGQITKEEADNMSDKDLSFLIFRSGVSTARKVTDISGRGVGMDIVKSHIEKLNGLVDIDSTVGKGTTFTIKLPLTLAIIRSLLVKIGDKEFAIPLVNVQEIVRLNQHEVKTIKNQEVGVVRDRVLPLVRMHKRLGVSEIKLAGTKRIFVIVIGLAEKRVGLVVDKTLGNQEIVIKPLGKYIGTPKYIAGATIMGDGKVAIILDTGAIVREEGTKDMINEELNLKNAKRHEEIIELATFKLGMEEYGIEIDRVKDIITVPPITRIMNAPHSVLGMINLRGKLIPVMDVRERFGINKTDLTRKSRIIVVELAQEFIGILVDKVTQVLKVSRDTIEAPIDSNNQIDEKYIRGISNLKDRLIILLDLDLILDMGELKAISKLTEENNRV
ncbi:chemotaxis protein histidine kinase-like protein [Schinkia azotoformans MEV2011]|uniref:Chemotaxis protein CheA n=1 Tax=Schinkia azotoformans MEV2011 TaxID=1348973 RepID=A0A072NRH0_SCHAZ|nr:chemotaxis protein CheA [Schinkia azotoformans]KEF40056.1 chemotaxis protein histidine kinase-like protein [Schinkia azotoformans MEV2011]MEC1694752.1 chemotaxis protein CheA [Schinkia azotoformans]MEC1716886.1 chemotaxis protein CheA [Schinkia azotoformans]MEC1726435.1 chemotaxis protein CheA [Schinkia azotoformans]MEC1743168.1 chemotaxis protein CheA [Schinkia azotoformans]